MKTTENISLSGYAFTIETDAYEALTAYLDSIRSNIRDDSSRDEIVSDIEERIAELLNEKCSSGVVVNMQMVNDITERIGNPELLAEEDAGVRSSAGNTSESHEGEKKGWRTRRLYRDIDERVIGGVCSGLGAYFGLDKVLFRIIFLIFLLLGFIGWDDGPYFGFSILAYVCLWIAMPAARTVEQKCEMKGKPMDLQGFKSKDFDIEKEIKEVSQSAAGQTARRAGGVFLGILMLVSGLCGFLGSIFIPTIPDIISHELSDNIHYLSVEDQMVTAIFTEGTFWYMVLVTVGIACVWFLYNGVMLLFDLKNPAWRPGLVLFIAWLISIFVVAAWLIKNIADVLPSLIY